MSKIEEQVSELQMVLREYIRQTNKRDRRYKAIQDKRDRQYKADQDKRDQEYKEWKKELAAKHEEWNRQYKADQDKRDKKHRQELEKLSKRLGTLVEDYVLPNIEPVAKHYFHCSDYSRIVSRIKTKKLSNPEFMREFDALVICEDKVILNETKSNPKPEYAKDFVDFVQSGEFFDYFPEHKDKTVIPIFSSFSLPKEIVSYLTKNKIYAMALKGDHMAILNFKAIAALDT